MTTGSRHTSKSTESAKQRRGLLGDVDLGGAAQGNSIGEDVPLGRSSASKIVLSLARSMESIRFSRKRFCCGPCKRLVLPDSDRDGAGIGADTVPLITGLSRVVQGTVPAAASVKLFNLRPPQYLFYMVSGFLCDIVQLCIDLAIHFTLAVQDPSKCWALGYALSVVPRHTSHRYLVFGSYVGGYWRSLGRMYAGYSIIIVISTLFNAFMTKTIALPHYVAWVITLLWTGIVNFFILKKLWSFGGKGEAELPRVKQIQEV